MPAALLRLVKERLVALHYALEALAPVLAERPQYLVAPVKRGFLVDPQLRGYFVQGLVLRHEGHIAGGQVATVKAGLPGPRVLGERAAAIMAPEPLRPLVTAEAVIAAAPAVGTATLLVQKLP